jgi:hypothetical protein
MFWENKEPFVFTNKVSEKIWIIDDFYIQKLKSKLAIVALKWQHLMGLPDDTDADHISSLEIFSIAKRIFDAQQ